MIVHADGQYGSTTVQASGFQISNTIRCFLCICQHIVNEIKNIEYRVIHKSVKHVRKLVDATGESRQ